MEENTTITTGSDESNNTEIRTTIGIIRLLWAKKSAKKANFK